MFPKYITGCKNESFYIKFQTKCHVNPLETAVCGCRYLEQKGPQAQTVQRSLIICTFLLFRTNTEAQRGIRFGSSSRQRAGCERGAAKLPMRRLARKVGGGRGVGHLDLT